MFKTGPRTFARRVHRAVENDNAVDVSESEGVRSLHLGSATIQSSMRLSAPNDLELAYTRGMMACLLFNPIPKQMLAIGLGGGSIPKFVHYHMPDVSMRVVEINPQVIAIARSHFALPADDARLEVIEGDGVVYVDANPGLADVLLLDAFDSVGIPDALSSQSFYDSCARALNATGIFVVNLWGSDKNFDVYLQRIEQSFSGKVLILPTGRPGNIAVFGFARHAGDLRWATLRERAQTLKNLYKIDFMDLLERIRDNNLNTTNRLLL